MFIDYGGFQEDLPADQIYDVSPDLKKKYFIDKLPPFAIECSLVKIKPKSKQFDGKQAPDGWNEEATRKFAMLSYNNGSIAKVRLHL